MAGRAPVQIDPAGVHEAHHRGGIEGSGLLAGLAGAAWALASEIFTRSPPKDVRVSMVVDRRVFRAYGDGQRYR